MDKSKIEIVDNFLPEDIFSRISYVLRSGDFPWYFTTPVAYENDKELPSSYYFTHLIQNLKYKQSNFFDLVVPVIQKLDAKAIIRIKANCYTNSKTKYADPFHTDFDYPHKAAILYVNTCDGPTIFKDGTEVESIANRLVKFNPLHPHASTRCTDEKIRVNINFNYF